MEQPPSPTHKSTDLLSPPASLQDVFTRLHDTKTYSWLQRKVALEWLRTTSTTNEGALAMCDAESMGALAGVLEAQLRDLRSAIVRDACLTVNVLSHSLKDGFGFAQPALARTLLELSGVGNKLIKELASSCAVKLFTTTQAPATIDVVLGILGTSRHPSVQEAGFLAMEIVVRVWQKEHWNKSQSAIERCIEQGANDASLKVRDKARSLYVSLQKICPVECVELLTRVDVRTKSRLLLSKEEDGEGEGDSSTSKGRSSRRSNGRLRRPASQRVSGTFRQARENARRASATSKSSSTSLEKPWLKKKKIKAKPQTISSSPSILIQSAARSPTSLTTTSISSAFAAISLSTSTSKPVTLPPPAPAINTVLRPSLNLPIASMSPRNKSPRNRRSEGEQGGGDGGEDGMTETATTTTTTNQSEWIKMKGSPLQTALNTTCSAKEANYFYYLNTRTNEISNQPWIAVRDAAGKQYYFNVITSSKRWRKPLSTGIIAPLRRALSEEGRRALLTAFEDGE